jgi:hypothetical protein
VSIANWRATARAYAQSGGIGSNDKELIVASSETANLEQWGRVHGVDIHSRDGRFAALAKGRAAAAAAA